MTDIFKDLDANLSGSVKTDGLTQKLYATDASVYRKIPQAVAYPETDRDIQTIIQFCYRHELSVVPRAAGTSLAGQCVGGGIIVDISKYFNSILKVDEKAKTVRLQPGVIRDDLNRYLAEYGLFFSPNTSTSNRCMLGGMLGNNSSGTTSIKYGVTRDKILEIKGVLSDGSPVHFKPLTAAEFDEKMTLDSREGEIYRGIYELLKDNSAQAEIKNEFPRPDIHRRNTGYAVDELLDSAVFSTSDNTINICKLLAGSEGTLVFTTEITCQLDDLRPAKNALVAAHFPSIQDCLKAVEPVMKHGLFTCEMMDKTILDCTKSNLKYKKDRFFIEEDPQAILMLELRDHSESELKTQVDQLLTSIQQETTAYATPVLKGDQVERAINLRKAGLGLLGNMQGDAKAVACVEDTAVAIEDLSDYIADFTEIMKAYEQSAVYYAHAGAGELHLRPILNLKKSDDIKDFREITKSLAKLVKTYRGSLSGEHGDGRVRAEFIRDMVGDKNYALFENIKRLFDPHQIFNPGKIVFPEAMDEALRYEPDREEPEIESFMDFSDTGGILRAVEQCNGTGDCRKSIGAGGTMCPSYRATADEKDNTRGRANALREFLTQSPKENRYDHDELKAVLDLCISCKGCKTECPSNVDMAAYKAEFQYQYNQSNGASFRDKVFANNNKLNALGAKVAGLTNTLFSNSLSAGIIKKTLGVAPERSLPKVAKHSLRRLIQKDQLNLKPDNPQGKVFLFVDEFIDLLDVDIGVDAIELLVGLGYEVKIKNHRESGRSYLSKGFLEEAKNLADKNIDIFKDDVSAETPLIGIEPSAILSFRDEYLRLAKNRAEAEELANNVLMIDEFLSREIQAGRITSDQFSKTEKHIKLHGHCHQKAMSSSKPSFDMLNLPENFTVGIIPSGCCGMAGSFGYEKEHYAISMKIGEHSLFPAVRQADSTTAVTATGTSCRHQIKDGTGRRARHPVSILRRSLL